VAAATGPGSASNLRCGRECRCHAGDPARTTNAHKFLLALILTARANRLNVPALIDAQSGVRFSSCFVFGGDTTRNPCYAMDVRMADRGGVGDREQ
jgi:hypothetical protein